MFNTAITASLAVLRGCPKSPVVLNQYASITDTSIHSQALGQSRHILRIQNGIAKAAKRPPCGARSISRSRDDVITKPEIQKKRSTPDHRDVDRKSVV